MGTYDENPEFAPVSQASTSGISLATCMTGLAQADLRVYTRNMDERCFCTALRQAAALSTAQYDAALAPAGIKVTMFRLMRRIDEVGETSISDLATVVGLDRSTLGRNLRVLEKQSLVRLSTGEDGRERRIALTAGGRTTLDAALPLWRDAQDAFARMAGTDMTALLDRLANLKSESGQKAGDAS